MKLLQNKFKLAILFFVICYLLSIFSIIIDSVFTFTVAFLGIAVFYYNTIINANES